MISEFRQYKAKRKACIKVDGAMYSYMREIRKV